MEDKKIMNDNGSNYLIGLAWLIPVALLIAGKIYSKDEVLLLSAVVLVCCVIFSVIDVMWEMLKHREEGGDMHGITGATITFFISIAALLFFRFTCDESVIDMVNNIMSEQSQSVEAETISTESVSAEPVSIEPVPAEPVSIEETTAIPAPVEETTAVSVKNNEDTDFTVVKKIASISGDSTEYQIYAEKDGKTIIITVNKDEYDKIAVGDIYKEE
jgi:hypothetical protein